MADREPWRAPRWLKLVLAGSLALNLAVLGVVGGLAWRLSGDGGPKERTARGEIALVAALERADRRVVLKGIGSRHRADRRDTARLRAELLAALRAEAFDAEAVAALLRQQVAIGDARREAVQAAWIARVGEMTTQARRRYADRLERWRGDRPKRRDK